MKKNYILFLLLIFSAVSYSQEYPPSDELCTSPMQGGYWNNYDGHCFQSIRLRSILNDTGGDVDTDSLYVRGVNSYGTFKTIPPLRKHFSVTNAGGGVATYDNGTGIFNIPSSTPFTGATNSSGNYVITYPVAYSTTPNVQFSIVGGDLEDVARLVSSTTTGFTINVQRRFHSIGNLPTFSDVNGGIINVLVTPY